MKVSVSITTYNHEPYIAQAIESVLRQQTNFDYELLIGEDDSTDATRDIVKAYGTRYPERIRLFLHDRKNVIHVKGRATGRRNFVNNLTQARGTYVALLDGDDYWTDPYKLQKQVDFLDAHPECSICFTAAVNRFSNNDSKPYARRKHKPFYKLDDILRGNFIPTCTTVYRNHLFEDFPAWFYKMPTGDWPLQILNAQHGLIGCIDEVTAERRVHTNGLWSSLDQAERYKRKLEGCKTMLPHMSPPYQEILQSGINTCHFKLMRLYADQKLSDKVRDHANRCLSSTTLSLLQRLELFYYRFYSPEVHRFVYPLRGVYRVFNRAVSY